MSSVDMSENMKLVRELYDGEIVTVREGICILRTKDGYHYMTTDHKDSPIHITKVTRQYLTEAYQDNEFNDYPDIRCPSLDKVVSERFWIHHVSDPENTITAAYLLGLDPVPTVAKWLEGLPVEVVVTDLNDALTTTKRASYRTAIYEIIKNKNSVATKLHTRYIGGRAFDGSLALCEVGLDSDNEVNEAIPTEEEADVSGNYHKTIWKNVSGADKTSKESTTPTSRKGS
jgi:hypothetical protein